MRKAFLKKAVVELFYKFDEKYYCEYLCIWTPTPITIPRSCCMYRATSKIITFRFINKNCAQRFKDFDFSPRKLTTRAKMSPGMTQIREGRNSCTPIAMINTTAKISTLGLGPDPKICNLDLGLGPGCVTTAGWSWDDWLVTTASSL